MTHPLRSRLQKRAYQLISILCAIAFGFTALSETAKAASSWNPTLLVNTEAFQTIDEGDGNSDIQIRFGQNLQKKIYYDRTNIRFVIEDSTLIKGNLTATGTLSIKKTISGANLRIDNNADIWGTLGVSGSTILKNTLTVNNNTKVRGNLSGSSLRIDNNADIWGGLSATGAIRTRSNITLNSGASTNDAVLTFGNNSGNQTLKYTNGPQRFEFSTNVSVTGTSSGRVVHGQDRLESSGSLIVNGSTAINKITYAWPASQGGANTFLKNDGAGNLTWGAASVGSSSGNILSLNPQFPNSVYSQSGSTAVGTLVNSSSGSVDNFYRWTSTRSALQDYWITTRVRLPKNFTHFETASGVVLHMRTSTTSAADNYITFRMIDSNNSAVAVGNNAGLVSSIANGWRTLTITNVTSGTYSAGGFITLLLKLAAKSTGITDLGYINLNWSATTP